MSGILWSVSPEMMKRLKRDISVLEREYNIKKIGAYFLFFLISVFFMGCSGRSASLNELNMEIPNSPLTVGPQMLYDVASNTVCGFSCSTLYVYNNNKELVPGLAESFDVSDDGLTYTFHLREDLKWSDGWLPDTAYGYRDYRFRIKD